MNVVDKLKAEEKYVDEGAMRCPVCRSERIEGGKMEWSIPVLQECRCLDCKSEWTDTLTVTACEINLEIKPL